MCVPVIANGNIQYLSDVERCLKYTGADGVMTAEGALNNPAIFMGRQPCVWEMADKYLQYVDKYPTPLGTVRGHLFRMWHYCLKKHLDLREPMGKARKLEELKAVSQELKERTQLDAAKDIEAGVDSEEVGKLPYWRCQPYVRPKQKNATEKRPLEEGETKKKNKSKKKLLREKHHERGGKGQFPNIPREKWPLCLVCKTNPWGGKCTFKRCKGCCKTVSAAQVQDCPGHSLYFESNLQNPRPCKKAKLMSVGDGGEVQKENEVKDVPVKEVAVAVKVIEHSENT